MLTKFSIKKPFTVLVAVIITIVFGFVSFTRMTPDLFPKMELPYVVVMTTYPGASAQEVEKTVTAPMEQQFASLENLKTVSSSSQKNASMIFLEFEQDAELDTVSVDIRDKAELASSQWNDTIQKPIILKMNPSMIPITVAAVSQDGKDINETSALLEEELLRKLEGTEGVAAVSTTGMVDNTIHISLDESKIKSINQKISDSIGEGFSDAKNQIKNQIANATKGIESINLGKNQVANAQEALVEQGDQIKEVMTALKTLTATKEGLELANDTIRKEVKNNLPAGATDAQIEAECMKNPIYVSNKKAINEANKGISTIIKGLKPMASQFLQFGIDINKLNTLQGVIDGETQLNKALQKAGDKLGNSMAELTGNSALLSAANMQLQASLGQIAQQEQTTKSTADISSYLTVDAISGLITAQDFEMPAGYITDDKKDVLVTVGDKLKSSDDLKNMVLLDMGIDGVEPVKLSDVANITYVSNGEDTYSKINGEDGIMLVFSKQSDYSTTEVANNIQDKFDELSGKYDGVEFETLSDQGDYIKMAIDAVLDSLVTGGILSILILLYFLRDIKPTLITAISIPVSITFAIVLMYFSGITLNVVSLAGLAVGIGMLVDNSIVVIENIYRLRSLGYSKIQSALSGAVQVAGAITASTLTTVCVFVPIVFVDGLTKTIFKDMALTVTYSLFASLIVALTIVPTLGSVSLNKVKENAVLGGESKAIKKYKATVEKALNHKAIVLSGVVVLLILTIGLSLMRGFEYMPSMATPQISATIEMPEGATKDDTIRICDEIAEEVADMKGVKTVGNMLSSNMAGMMGMSTSSTDFSSVTLYVLMNEDDIEKGTDVTDKIKKMGEANNCEVTVSGGADMTAMMGGSGVSINIESDDLDDLRTSALKIEEVLSDTEGLSDISDVAEESTEEVRVSVDKEEAVKYGLTVAQVYAQIAEKISTEKVATKLDYDGESKDVVVTGKSADKLNEEQLMNIELKGSGSGASKTVKLSEIATVSHGNVLDAISRINQKRAKTVSAKVDEGYNITKQTDKVKEQVDKLDLPKGVSVEFAGEDKQIMDAMEQLMNMFLLGILLVYLVMVAQFQSLLSPFIVMFTVPLAITGALAGLLITGFEVSVVSMIGMIVLMGIIVNNAIVLIDYINQMRAEGIDKREAIIQAGAVRMRPVLMTAITTILGLMPMAIGMGSGAEMMQPVAIVCVGGLIYATLMTLFIIPIMYDILARKNVRKISKDELTLTDS